MNRRRNLFCVVTLIVGVTGCSNLPTDATNVVRRPTVVTGGPDIWMSHECSNTIVIKNGVPSSTDSTLFRWKARSDGPNSPVIATDTIRVPNPAESGAGYVRFDMPDSAGFVALHKLSPASDTLDFYAYTYRSEGAVACGQRIPFYSVVSDDAWSSSIQSDSVVIGQTVQWWVHGNWSTDAIDSVAVYVNGIRQPGTGIYVSGSAVVDSSMDVFVWSAAAFYPPEPLLSESQAFITQLRAIAGSSDPVAAAESLMTDMLDFALDANPAMADSVLSQVGRLAFDFDSDSALMGQIDSVLAGRMLEVNPSPSSSMRSLRSTPQLGEPTKIVLVNGIWTPAAKFSTSVMTTSAVLRDVEVPEVVRVKSFWNPSNPLSTGNYDECMFYLMAGGSEKISLSAVIRYCLPLVGGVFDENDLTEASSQIISHFIPSLIPPREISLELADSLQAIRDQGSHVTVVGHSQGMLIAREAVNELVLTNRYNQMRDSVCLGAIGLGGPSSGGWNLPVHQVDEYAVEHDLVAALSFQPRVTTALSLQLDSANAGASILKRFVNRITYGVRLHDLDNSYLRDPASVTRLLSSVDYIRGECEVEDVVPLWTSPLTIYRGDELASVIYFQVNNFNGRRLYGRTIGVSSTDSTIINLLPNRMLRALDHGSASILATSGSATGSLPFVVAPVPNVLPTGGRSGTWRITNPLIEDSIWITGLTQIDSVTPLGEYVVSGGTVNYRHNGSSYSVPALNAKITPGGPTPTLRFNMATPEFSDPASYATVQLSIYSGGRLYGGAVLYGSFGIRETRGWDLYLDSP